ncbi:MAG TPA: copper resistance protein B [Steroidobacteraceae bacterium]|nr:copper resistance protein B [Steroidobacteraceae bacterium]
MSALRRVSLAVAPALALIFCVSPAAEATQPMQGMTDRSMGALMGMDDAAPLGKFMLDQLEAEGGSGGTATAWDAQAWYGGDYDKVWLKSEGSPDPADQDTSRNELLWDHALTRWWDLQTGVRYDLSHGPARGWAALGIQGLAPYWFEVEATLYVGEAGRTAARVRLEHDLAFSQRLFLQPEFETDLYGKSDPARAVRSGLSDLQLGLRLRYEVRREFAPYVGVAWRRTVAATLKPPGPTTPADSVVWVAGFHVWL